MYFCVRQQLKNLPKEDYLALRELSWTANDLYNMGLRNVRKHYISEGKHLDLEQNVLLCRGTETYKLLQSNMGMETLRRVDTAYRSFFAALRRAKKNNLPVKNIEVPKLFEKEICADLTIGVIRINGNQFTVPFSRAFLADHRRIKITVPPVLQGKKVKIIRITPKYNARFFEVHYIYEAESSQKGLDRAKALAIDVGMDNLAACVTSEGKSFIIDGRRLKSINQWFIKRYAYLQTLNKKQGIKHPTRQQCVITDNRNNAIRDYINKTCRYIIDYCLEHDIGNVVIGYNKTPQKGGIPRGGNHIPFSSVSDKLAPLCKRYGINFVKVEESYTSKASFWDNDDIPEHDGSNQNEPAFSGERVKRGLYRTAAGIHINADINGALNILKKSSVVDLSVLYGRGEVDTPARIRIA